MVYLCSGKGRLEDVTKITTPVGELQGVSQFAVEFPLTVLVERIILPLFNGPADEDSKTHLTFLPTLKIDQVTEPAASFNNQYLAIIIMRNYFRSRQLVP